MILMSSLVLSALVVVAAWPIYSHFVLKPMQTPVEEIDVTGLCEAFGPGSAWFAHDAWNDIGGLEGAMRIWRNSARIAGLVAAALATMDYSIDAQREFRREAAEVRRGLFLAFAGKMFRSRWLCRIGVVNAAQSYCNLTAEAAIICADQPVFMSRLIPGI